MVVFLQDFRVNAWEKRKLGQIAEILMGQSPDSKNYTTDPKDYILVQGNADIKNGWVYPRVWTTQVTKIAKKGSVLLSVRAPVGEVARSAFDVVLGRGVASIGHDDFLYHYLVRMKENGFWLKLSTGSTFDSINSKDIKEAALFVPEKPEQQKISRILNSLNHLIAATQGKFDQLQMVKKALLQHLFDQSMRFKGYSDPWEKRKLGDLMKVTSVKRVHQSDWRKEGVPFLRARDIIAFNKGQKIKEPIYISESQYEKYVKQSGRVTPGDLLVTGVGSIGGPFVVKAKTPLYFKDGNIIWFQNKTLDPDFLFYQFTSASVQSFVMSSSGKGTVGTFTISSGKRTPIVFPVMSEQR